MKDPARKRAMLKKIMRDVNNCERCKVGLIENERNGSKLPFDLDHADSEIMFTGICPGLMLYSLQIIQYNTIEEVCQELLLQKP